MSHFVTVHLLMVHLTIMFYKSTLMIVPLMKMHLFDESTSVDESISFDDSTSFDKVHLYDTVHFFDESTSDEGAHSVMAGREAHAASILCVGAVFVFYCEHRECDEYCDSNKHTTNGCNCLNEPIANRIRFSAIFYATGFLCDRGGRRYRQ